MSKRNTVRVSVLSASALAMLLLLSTVTAQKSPNSAGGNLVSGIEFTLGKYPAAGVSERRDAGKDGVIHAFAPSVGRYTFSPAPGRYWIEIVPPLKQPNAAGDVDYNYLVVEIKGARVVGGTARKAWQFDKKQFVSPMNATARVTTVPDYSDRMEFEIENGPPTPCFTTIIRSKSNIANN